MAKFTKLSEAKPHPAVWNRVAHSLHWGVDLKTILKKAGINMTDWNNNADWVLSAYSKSAHYKSGDYDKEVFNPLAASYSASKVPAYTD